MAKSNLRLIAPTAVNRTVTPRRPKNADLRTREHLTTAEVEKLIEAAKQNRHGNRDGLMALLAFRHGLRAAEVVDLRWEQVDFATATLHVRRVKAGTPASHPLTGRELRELRRHKRESIDSPFVFVSERGAPKDRDLRADEERAMLHKNIDVDGLNIFYREAGKAETFAVAWFPDTSP